MTTFQIPASKASIDQNRFKFSFPGSKKQYSIPLMKFLKPHLGIAFEERGNLAATKMLLDEYYPNDSLLERFEDVDQLEAFSEAYAKASGIDLGESEGSADS